MLEDLLQTVGGVGETAGNPILFGITVIGSLLQVLFGGIFGGTDVSSVNAAVQQLRGQLSDAIAKLTRFGGTIAFALGALLQTVHDLLAGFLSHIWDELKKLASLVKSIIDTLLHDLVKLLKWVWQEGIPNLVKAIQKIRTQLNHIYAVYIRPILNYLQIVRRYLAILKAFHVKWAGVLDAKIAAIESRIIGPYLYVLRTLNGIGNWVNLVITAGAVLQRPVFINTMFAYQSDWMNMFWWGQGAQQLPGALAPDFQPKRPESLDQIVGDMGAFVSGGGGPYAEDAAKALKAFGNPDATL